MNLNLKYSNIAVICIFQMVSADTIDPFYGVDWLKLADTKDSLPHLMQTIFDVGCVRTVNTKKSIFGVG
jgi:hypothetical protein